MEVVRAAPAQGTSAEPCWSQRGGSKTFRVSSSFAAVPSVWDPFPSERVLGGQSQGDETGDLASVAPTANVSRVAFGFAHGGKACVLLSKGFSAAQPLLCWGAAGEGRT